MKYAIGVDLGGTNIAVGIVDGARREIVHKESIKTRAPRPCKEIAQDICDLSRAVCEHYGIALSEVAWVGVGTPGIVKDGVVLTASNLGWNNDPLGEYIKEGLKVPCYVGNDANVAAFAEAVWGSGHGDPSLVAITLGTGVGGGIVINGKIWDGFNGFAAEIGHMVIRAEGRECPCGKRGCLETEVSGWAAHREFISKLKQGSISMLSKQFKAGNTITLNDILDVLAKEDMLAIEVMEKIGSSLGRAIAGLINLFNPEVVVLAGTLASAKDYLMHPMKSAITKYALNFVSKDTSIKVSKLGEQAGLIGICAITRNRMLGLH